MTVIEGRPPQRFWPSMACVVFHHPEPAIAVTNEFDGFVIHHRWCPRCGADVEGRIELRSARGIPKIWIEIRTPSWK